MHPRYVYIPQVFVSHSVNKLERKKLKENLKYSGREVVKKQILAARKGTEGAEMCVVKTITKPGSRLICFCHSSVQKKSAHNLSYNNNITKVLHTFLWIGGMFTK